MRLVYSKRALADLDQIATYYTAHASPAIAEEIGRQLLGAIARIGRQPESSQRITQRSQVRVATVVRYPFRLFLPRE